MELPMGFERFPPSHNAGSFGIGIQSLVEASGLLIFVDVAGSIFPGDTTRLP